MPVLTVATDCSGMDTPMMALHALGVQTRHLFSCDTDHHAKATIMANFPPEHFYDDLTKRDNARAPKADLYIAGFPCQPFSLAGNKQGFADQRGRGKLCFKIFDYIKEALPRVFVLENVSGLKEVNGGRAYTAIMKSLQALGEYNVHAEEMNTKDHGIPQNRRRIYFIGIRKDCDQGTFSYPTPLPSADLNDFLDPLDKTVTMMCLPPKSQTTAHRNVQLTVKALLESHEDPFRDPWVIDCDSSTNRMKYWKGLSPCLTHSRYRGHWITNRGRRLTLTEMMRLMGMMTPEAGFTVVVSETQLGKQIGNAMSCNVLERLLVRLLPAAGLAAAEDLTDRWARAASTGVPPTFPCYRPVPGLRPLAAPSAPRLDEEPGEEPEVQRSEEMDAARLEALAARLEAEAAAQLAAALASRPAAQPSGSELLQRLRAAAEVMPQRSRSPQHLRCVTPPAKRPRRSGGWSRRSSFSGAASDQEAKTPLPKRLRRTASLAGPETEAPAAASSSAAAAPAPAAALRPPAQSVMELYRQVYAQFQVQSQARIREEIQALVEERLAAEREQEQARFEEFGRQHLMRAPPAPATPPSRSAARWGSGVLRSVTPEKDPLPVSRRQRLRAAAAEAVAGGAAAPAAAAALEADILG